MSNRVASPRERFTELLLRADSEGFAVPAFNYSDIWDFLAITEAAEQMRSPVFISSNQRVVTDIGIELCGAIGAAAIRRASIPLIHHLDHSNRAEICRAAVDNGYPSVMIDASSRPLEDNITIVAPVAEYAHERGVLVEGEIGRIKGAGVEGMYTGEDFLAQVDEAVRFVHETGVDTLAVGIGTAHGFYQGKPEIHFDRLEEINHAVSVPLVLHGGTGVSEEEIRQAIRRGINKVNVGTIIHCTYMNAVRAELQRRGENAYTLDVMVPVRAAVREEVEKWIRVCMADGKAR
ncbi:MAG: class II fructose-bisphosphate aldolase [Spirochaetales bacterium]|nr:class II fructose-bisphosphate aldolase [Spirochaetales bacterium]